MRWFVIAMCVWLALMAVGTVVGLYLARVERPCDMGTYERGECP